LSSAMKALAPVENGGTTAREPEGFRRSDFPAKSFDFGPFSPPFTLTSAVQRL
jgi:hypothetical protein